MSAYEFAILGSPETSEKNALTKTLGEMVSQFGLAVGKDVLILDGISVGTRDKRASFAATYFGASTHADMAPTAELIRFSAPVIPTIGATGKFSTDIPSLLESFNGLKRRSDDVEQTELAAAMLECAGLLRRQRRAFISYRREESRAAATQLHDLLSARGFDAFLDTHDIRPGDPFQDVLWHRLCDSDVMVMLDTRTYFARKWTRQELGRARAKEIHVLRVVWPDYLPTPVTDYAETIYLDKADLVASDGPLVDTVADRILLALESLRSRSVASRYMSITGRLRSELTKIGATIGGIGAHRAISIQLADGSKMLAYPIVGVPTAELLNDVENQAQHSGADGTPILVYDHVGIRKEWIRHLGWLDDKIRSVRAIKVSEAAYTLAAWIP